MKIVKALFPILLFSRRRFHASRSADGYSHYSPRGTFEHGFRTQDGAALPRSAILRPFRPLGRVLRAFLIFYLVHAASFAAVDHTAPDIYTPSEKTRLISSKSLNDRIRVYDAAFVRIWKEMEKDIRTDRVDAAARTLNNWSALLNKSLSDIEVNVNPKKKPKRLKQYEIHLRQAINGFRSLLLQSPVELHDAIIYFGEQLEDTRRKFINIIFNLHSDIS